MTRKTRRGRQSAGSSRTIPPVQTTAWLASVLVATACSASPGGVDGGTDAPVDAPEPPADAPFEPPPLAWTPCSGGAECASLEVPLDHAEPGGARVTLAVVRRPARLPAERLGVLVVNPGGPGASAVDYVASVFTRLPAGAFDRFDVVAFDWRGTGGSLPSVSGASGATSDALRHLDLGGDPVAAEATVDAFASEVIGASDLAFLAAVGTDTSARDMEVLRRALGETTLNFLGLSYGTWLGATYAALHPDRVRAFVLDSAFPPGADIRVIARLEAAGYDEALGRFFDWCARTATCTFRSAATDAAGVAALYDALMGGLEATPIAAGSRTLDAADAQTAVSRLLAGRQWSAIGTGLAAAAAGDGRTLLGTADQAWSWTGTESSSAYRARSGAILFADHALAADFRWAEWNAFLADEVDALGPRLGRHTVAFFAAAPLWPRPSAAPPPIAAPDAPPLLVLAGAHDPATPLAGATSLLEALGNGSHLVVYEGDGHGTTSRSTCMSDLAGAFLLEPVAPATATCPDEMP